MSDLNGDAAGHVHCEWPSNGQQRRGRAAWRTTVGLVRETNEDAALFAARGYGNIVGAAVAGEVVPSAHGFLLGVFDGVAGCSDGAAASLLARDAFMREVGRPGFDAVRVTKAVNTAVYNEALASKRKLATTMTAGTIIDDRLGIIHVGDSRAYLFRDNELHQLTRDHTVRNGLVESYVREGASREAAERRAAESGWGSALAQAIGAMDDVDADYVEVELREHDVVIFTTDGVHGVVEEGTILRAALASSPEVACEVLLEMTRAAGAPDNATAVAFVVDGWVA